MYILNLMLEGELFHNQFVTVHFTEKVTAQQFCFEIYWPLGMFKLLEEKYITWNDLQHWSWNWNFYFAFDEFANYDQPKPLCKL